MGKSKCLILILFLLLFFFSAKSAAGEDLRKFDREEWEDMTEGVDYTEEQKPPEDLNSNPIELPGQSSWFGDAGPVLQIVLYVLIGALIIFILYKLIKSNIFVRNKKVSAKKVFSIEDADEHIHESDLERFLRESLENKDYRQAVRIYYLMVIRGLSMKNLINWQKDKTNFQYLMEVRKSDLYTGFSDLTLFYEQIWYGNAMIEENIFNKLSPVFKSFIEEINKKKI